MLRALSLAIIALLKMVPGKSIAHFGMKFSSFCGMNKGTSARSASSSLGNILHKSVQYSNLLLERTGMRTYTCSYTLEPPNQTKLEAFKQALGSQRTVLLVMLATSLDVVWSLEQPSGSVLEFYPAWRSFLVKMCDICGPYAA